MGFASLAEDITERREELLAFRKSLVSFRNSNWLGTGTQSSIVEADVRNRIEGYRSNLDRFIGIVDKLLEFLTDPSVKLVEELQRAKRERGQAVRREQAAKDAQNSLQSELKHRAVLAELIQRNDNDDSVLQDRARRLVTENERLKTENKRLKSSVAELESENDDIKEQHDRELEGLRVAKRSEYRTTPGKSKTKRQEVTDRQQSRQEDFEALMEKKGVRRM
jgi:hypothetical protein